ncbi:AAA family ATPase [Deinococcus yavapaiensis]|uniref:AAA domain-containing protein n=1 Tax=Deinococcus yavapaiensis KR-236 TaxID=694435 RepID=A0A318SRD0_9DEIO|nr:AAA family ATPase [Deinococcus yavapaiensis]PYE55483.1 AAA domain-containing protein [Deinococcus yavapaiensis KR-236]
MTLDHFRDVDLHAPLQRIEFLDEDLFPMRNVSLVAAREGVGKTTLLTHLLWQVTRPPGIGRFMGRAVRHGGVLYINTDAPDDGESRGVRYWLEQHRNAFPDGRMELVRVLEPNEHGLLQNSFDELIPFVLERDIIAVVLDSFMASFPGVNPNKQSAVMGPMVALRELATATGAAVIVTDHLPKAQAGERDGARGVTGSVAKMAQVRAVHILTVEDASVEGHDVLRWQVQKASYAPSRYAFGVEVVREGGGDVDILSIELHDLPDGKSSTRTSLASMAVMRHVERSAGHWVRYGDLVKVAMQAGALKERAAKDAVRSAVQTLLVEGKVEESTLSERGAPKAYRVTSALPECLELLESV